MELGIIEDDRAWMEADLSTSSISLGGDCQRGLGDTEVIDLTMFLAVAPDGQFQRVRKRIDD